MNETTSGSGQWMIYGANGYTGRLCAREAVRRGQKPVLAGRNADALRALAGEFGLDHRVFPLDNPEAIAAQLVDVDAVLHCAGPFSATARPMLDACRLSKTHYLDITGEIEVFEYVHGHAELWRDAGIVALPGVGFDVVPTDCLAAMLKEALPTATHLRLAFKSRRGKMSPGTSKTVLEGLSEGCCIRQDGELVRIPLASKTETFPFRDGPAKTAAIPWGDVSTAFHSTGIPNIEVYTGASEKDIKQFRRVAKMSGVLGWGPVQKALKGLIGHTIHGPTDTERERDEVQLYGEATDAAGNTAAFTMRTPEAYSLTADAALKAVDGILSGTVPPGPATPSSAFGSGFVLELEGVDCRPVE
jgi:short subunit dehydrogenase-like uncharacterized protein